MRILAALLLGAAATGCIDFVEPELSERGAPAVARLVAIVSDSGRLSLNAEATPGFDEAGFRRSFENDLALVGPFEFAADQETDAGGLRWAAVRPAEPALLTMPLELRPPPVEDAGGPPAVRWAGAERAGPDTLRLEEEGGLRLALRVEPLPQVGPPPGIRQWFLTLTGDDGAFRLSADGPPPDTLDIPARFIPAFEEALMVRLVYQQSGVVEEARYQGLFTLDVRLHWTVRRREAT